MFRRFAVTRRIVKVGLRARNHFSVGPKRSGFEQSQVIRKIFKRPNNVYCPIAISFLLITFGQFGQEFPSSSHSKFSSAHVFPRLTHQTHSPVRVEASFMIFTNLPSSVSNSDKLSSGQFGWERFGLSGSEPPSWSLLAVRLRFRISRSRSGTPVSFLLVRFGQFSRERFGLKVLSGSEPPSWSFLTFRLQFQLPFSVSWDGNDLKSSQGQSLHHDLC